MLRTSNAITTLEEQGVLARRRHRGTASEAAAVGSVWTQSYSENEQIAPLSAPEKAVLVARLLPPAHLAE